jgi:diguanylate cyclase (GGDEF)-like protein
MESPEHTDRTRFENRIMAELTSLALSDHGYADVVPAVLDLVEQVVSSPFLSLTVQETRQVGFYPRVGDGVDALWAEDVGRYVAETQRHQLSGASRRGLGSSAGGQRPSIHHSTAPEAWIAAFPASRDRANTIPIGGFCILTLGCPQPLSLRPDEEQIMERLARQSLLALDHALLMEQLENQEVMDGLTGVANHRRLLEILDYEMQRHRYLDKWLSLLLIDVEGLDRINRSYGRQYGNHILAKLAGLLQETVRPIDSVARCGMDEFAVVLPETDDEEASELAERVRERMLSVGFAGGAVGLTVGVTQVKPDEVLSAESFLRRGEQVLHEAKRQEQGWLRALSHEL